MLTASRPLPSATDAVALLLTQPRPAGRRVAVVASGADVSAAAAAALEEAGLLPADVTQHCDMRTRFVAPTATHTGGSVILPRGTADASLRAVLATLAEDPGVDAVVVAVDPTPWPGAQLARTLDAVSREYPRVTVVAAFPSRAPPGTWPSAPSRASPTCAGRPRRSRPRSLRRSPEA